MTQPPPKTGNRLRNTLLALFALALLMGPGPGILLVNPDPADPASPRLLLGLPVIYLWASFWFGVQALVVVLAYRLLWRRTDPDSGAA